MLPETDVSGIFFITLLVGISEILGNEMCVCRCVPVLSEFQVQIHPA